MSEKSPRSFDKIEKATVKFQEERYMDSLMGKAVGGTDEQSNKRREEAKEYDAHLGNMDENRKQRDDETFNTEVPSSERDPLLRKIEFVSEQIEKIKNDMHNAKDAIVEKDLASKEALRKDLITKYKNAYGPMHGPKTFEQAVIDGEVMHGPEYQNEEDSAREAILNPDNVAALRAELAGDESDDSEVTPIVPVDPIPPTDPSEIVDGNETPGTDLVVREPMPADPAERDGWFRRNRTRIIAGVAIVAAGAALSWAALSGNNNKDNQRSGSDDKTEQPGKKGGGASKDDVMKKVKFSQNFSDKNHSDNKVNAWGTERTQLVENAPLGELRGEALNEYIDNHDKITAKNVEKLVNVRFQEMYGLDANKFNSAWGQQEREKMKRKYLSDSGHSLSKDGQRAHAIHLSELRSGKILKMTASEAASKYGIDVNSYMKEGKLKGGIDDFAYATGATHDDIYVRFDKDGNVEGAEIGVCANDAFTIIEGSSSTPLGTPESTPDTDQPDDTFEAISEIEGDIDWPTGEKKKHTPKSEVKVDHEGTANTGGVEATGPGPETQQQNAGSQTSDQANEQTGGGSQGSTNPAEGADQGPKPSTPNDGASGETSSGTVNEQG